MIHSDLINLGLFRRKLWDKNTLKYPCQSPVFVVGVSDPMRCGKCDNCKALREIVFGDVKLY